MKKLIFFLLILLPFTQSFSQQNKFFVELKSYHHNITYDKVTFSYESNKDSIKKWNKYNNIYIDYKNSYYSNKSFCINDTLYISIDPVNNINKFWLFFGSMEIKNTIEPILYDNMDTIKIGYSMVKENSYINGYVYKIEIDPDLYSTYGKRFYIIFKKY
jgi:GLPGLI family protein